MRTKLTNEIAALRVQSARETQRRDWMDIAPIDKPSTRTLFVRLSQLAVLDARYPPPPPASTASSNNGGADGGYDDSECLVAPERCDWSFIGAGLNPNFAYEGPWGPKKTVDASPAAAALSVVDLYRPVSPKTVVGFPQRARVRASTMTSAQRRSNGTGRYYADLMVSDKLAKFDVRFQHVPIEKRAETKTQFVEHYRKELAKDVLYWQRVPTDFGNKMWKAKVGEAALYEKRFPAPRPSQQAVMELPERRTYWGKWDVPHNPNASMTDPFRAKRTRNSPTGEERAVSPKGTRTID
ncbi:hypothetical protein IWX90DRAFT_487383 [Phyllosticta citrichinensis]|uniref:Uncharacterized protein n=1 Tax=Phyllosticta citrichinensis TaxID=1130410 RepID=A0ABR1XQW7_9PEZI